MKKILFLFLVAGLLYACKKDKIGSKPFLSFKSYSADSISPTTDQFVVTLNVEDGDGDIEDTLRIAPIIKSHGTDTLFIKKKMPGIESNKGNKIKGEIQITLQNQEIIFGQYAPIPKDSVHFMVFIKDNAGNISDTVYTPKIAYRSR
ncbi:MAG: hypothetical protein J7623_26325 [Chitinophaga sp.]|uniref:hypothetical protein n=1 Tax=Chitinophaga sp. TaxID=1869181 RepID=UPI001B12B092|nr:hypothetical protein [Chitinophaga sp.]MBO9732186.1 hypothetical protein [Chitinophaga sp.]